MQTVKFPKISKKMQGKVMCDKNKISDWTADNSTATICWNCPVCRRSWGSTFSCGNVKKHSSEKPIKCEKCVKGKTFSSRRSTDICRTCEICQKHRTVLQKCNRRNNTVCGGCEKGYYEYKNDDVDIKTCEKCSRCCGDGNDDKVKECIDQGLPPNQVCSTFDEEQCKTNDKETKQKRSHQGSTTKISTPKPKKVGLSTDSKSSHIERPLEPSNVVHPTKPKTIMEHNSNNVNINNNISMPQPSGVDPIAIIVPVAIFSSVALLVIGGLLAWYFCYKRKKKLNENTANRSGGNKETTESLRSQRSDDCEDSPEESNESALSDQVNLNRNGEDQPAGETSTIISLELQPLQTSASSDINDNKQASTKVGEYLDDNERHSQAAFTKTSDEMDNPNFKRDFKGVVCPLGVEHSKVHYIQNNGQGAFETLLENRAAQDPSKTLEEIAQAFEKRDRQDLAQNMRIEDRRMKDKKARVDSEQPG